MTDPTPGGPGWAAPGGRASSGPVPYEPEVAPPQQQGWQQPGWQQQPGWGAPVATAPKPGVVPLRPLGLGEVLDGAVALVRGYPRAALGVSAVVALVTTLIQLGLLFT